MLLKNLSLVNFKNYESAQVSFINGVNALVGDNGQGKTNVLDAIYYLSFCKSFFNAIDSQNIKHEQDFFVLQGNYEINEEEIAIYCGVKQSQGKIFKKNKKEYERLGEHIGAIPLVMISPYDSDLINEGSEVRRRFIDGVISQYNSLYLKNLQLYTKVLKQRNVLLKQFADQNSWNEEMLLIYDSQLCEYGYYIYEERKRFLAEFTKAFNTYYGELAKVGELPEINYQSHLNELPLETSLLNARRNDKAAQFTTVGLHKDDLVFRLNGYPIKKYGSQGQQKTFLIALKLAQYQLIKETSGKKPLLLLDDIFDKIDDKRVTYLLSLIDQGAFGQIFLSDTDAARVERILTTLHVKYQVLKIESGEINND